MAGLLQSFAGLSLKPATRQQAFVSNGTVNKVAMKSKLTYQVEVVVGNDEPQDSALKRFRREVMSAGLVPEVRRRRYFENNADIKKRKYRDSRIKAKRNKQYPPKTYAQEVSEEPSPFSDMFGTADDIFADVLSGSDGKEERKRF